MSIAFTAAPVVPPTATTIGVPVFEGLEVTDGAPVRLDRDYAAQRDFAGRPGEALAVPGPDGTIVVALGMGARDGLSAESFRRAGAALARAAQKAPVVAFWLRGAVPKGLEPSRAAQAVVEGAALAAYRFNAYKADPRPSSLVELIVVGSNGKDVDALDAAVRRGATVARAVTLARDLVNEPAGALTPRRLAQLSVEVAEQAGLGITVMDEVAIANAGLGGLAGVAQGSEEPARLIELDYRPDLSVVARAFGRRRQPPTLARVGKGITFDSGGLSLKSAEGMMTM